jgi:DNA-binding MarR family transcriptional regulator
MKKSRAISQVSDAVRRILAEFQRTQAANESGDGQLSRQDLRILEYLCGFGTQKMKCIATYLGVAVNSVTTIIDNLEARDLVVRRRSLDDRRVVHVELTAAGRTCAEAIEKSRRLLIRTLLDRLSEEEQEVFARLLSKFADGSGRSAAVDSGTPSAAIQEPTRVG